MRPHYLIFLIRLGQATYHLDVGRGFVDERLAHLAKAKVFVEAADLLLGENFNFRGF